MFEGRLDNMNYFYGALISIVLGYVLMWIPLLGWLLSLALAIVGFAMTARRFRDIGVTGWASLLLFVPLANILAIVYLCWRKGDTAANLYGPTPDPKREMFRAILNT
jgi:uncharacterized membrane protein YhaH (DUF805 family)